MSSHNTKPHTVIATWRLGHGAPRLDSGESLEGRPWLRVVAVRPKRGIPHFLQHFGPLLDPLKDIDRLFLPDAAHAFIPKVNVVLLSEPDGAPLVFKGAARSR
jgi:hypothetical protein